MSEKQAKHLAYARSCRNPDTQRRNAALAAKHYKRNPVLCTCGRNTEDWKQHKSRCAVYQREWKREKRKGQETK